jgi:hypothetical protein
MELELEEKEAQKESQSWNSVRKSSDIEQLYRFLEENNLRREAKIVFEAIWKKIGFRRKKP